MALLIKKCTQLHLSLGKNSHGQHLIECSQSSAEELWGEGTLLIIRQWCDEF